MDEEFIRRNFRLVSEPEEIFKRANAFCVDAWGRITGVNASECQLQHIDVFAELNGLQYLDLSLNEIENADPLRNLPSLQAVDLAFNRLDRIDFVLDLAELRFLDARNNRIKRLPSSFADLSLPLLMEYEFQQYGIFLDGNPLGSGFVEALHQGHERVVSYLKSIPDDGNEPSRRSPRRPLASVLLAETAADTVPEPGLGRVRGADRLEAAADADMLATVLMARSTVPPLAVGLFGEWGSGKSFLMALMQERIDELAALKRAGHEGAEAFCGEVRQVRFNAWHFVDTNLWASLAAALFDGLASDSRPDDAAVLLGDLDRARETAMKAREERESLEREVRSLEARVGSSGPGPVPAVSSALRAVRDNPELQEELRVAALQGGETKEETDEIVAAIGNLHGLWQSCTALGLLFRDELLHRYRWRAIAAFIMLWVVVVAVFEVGAVSVVAKLVALLAGFAVLLAPAANGAFLVLRLARHARIAREMPLRERQRKLAAATEAEEKSNQAVSQQERELREIREKGARLQKFVRDRALSSDYTDELGVISKMRRDLEELVSLLPSGAEAGQPAVAGSVADRVPEVERIILYIDDLDRCPGEKVLDVLQAIHLLLAFKLFVVVVGVDSRWLQGSLKAQYGSLLDEPEDYLEKIFQIPFTVKPMSSSLYGDLIKGLTSPTSKSVSSSANNLAKAGSNEIARDGGATLSVHLDGEQSELPPKEDELFLPKPDALVISESEIKLLGSLGPLAPTPRSAKRLVNIYRMLRVSAADANAVGLEPEKNDEYQAVIVLLAIVIGLPELVADIFREINGAADSEDIWVVTDKVPGAGPRLEHLRSHVHVTTIATYRRWVPQVARFSFRAI
jgi:KAP family P-loop domain